jgi:hypothetical protein
MMPSYACAHCGEPFIPARSDARFCGGRCRIAHHRAGPRKGAADGSPVPPVAAVRMAQASISLDAALLDAVDATARARGLTRSAFIADVVRAALNCP